MAYATLANLLEQLAEPDLISLTDDAQDGVVNEAVIAWALSGADALIDAHCHDRYQVPSSDRAVLSTAASTKCTALHLEHVM